MVFYCIALSLSLVKIKMKTFLTTPFLLFVHLLFVSFEIVRPTAPVHQAHQMMVAVAIVQYFSQVKSLLKSFPFVTHGAGFSQFLCPEIFMG